MTFSALVADTAGGQVIPDCNDDEPRVDDMTTNLNDRALHGGLEQGVLKVWQVGRQGLTLLQGKHDHLGSGQHGCDE